VHLVPVSARQAFQPQADVASRFALVEAAALCGLGHVVHPAHSLGEDQL
jgi:hypothetical protein